MEEVSAFEAYKKEKKSKKKRAGKGDGDLQDTNKVAGNVHKHVEMLQGSKRNVQDLNIKGEFLWDSFVSHIKKKKKMDVSTPIPTNTHAEGSLTPADNIFFLDKPKKKKRKKKPATPTAFANGNIDEEPVDNKVPLLENNAEFSGGIFHFSARRKSKLKKKSHDTTKPLSVGKETYIVQNSCERKDKFGKEVISPPLDSSASSIAPRIQVDSRKAGREMLEWILSPVPVDTFFEQYWEKKPLHISRLFPKFFDGIFSMKDLDRALRDSPMFFGKNVDVTSYENGVRTTENPEGRARPQTVWELYEKGRSIRVLNPQTFIPNVGIIVSTLQEYFKCMVGVNSYLTPAGTQGFAPHYDDIEAFVLQLEGEKLWKVYPPRNDSETLPRYSSPNFSQDEIGEPMLEVKLEPGDLLYFPRGFIHQARSVEEHHSLHITVSTYQCNTWGDLMEKALNAALQLAREEIVELREGLPINFLDHLGLIHSESQSTQRAEILEKVSQLFSKVVDVAPWDAAADQIGKQYIHDSYPPYTDNMSSDILRSWMKKPKGSVKLLTASCIRLVSEDDTLILYYNTDNSKEYHGEEPQGFEIAEEAGPVVEALIQNYPEYTRLKDLTRDGGVKTVRTILTQLAAHSLLVIKP